MDIQQEQLLTIKNAELQKELSEKKAELEAKTRELEIEAALEKVRERTIAMHKSEDLLKVITVVSEQLKVLDFQYNTVSFAINNQDHDYKFWFAVQGNPNPFYIQVPYIQNPMFDRMKDVLAKGIDFYTDTLTPEESREWHEHVFSHSHIPSLSEKVKAKILKSGYARSIAITPSIMLILSNYAGKPYSNDENEIIKRFAGVFEQSYTRFLDLQKAEAQAREAQIEAALERVRAKAMAMHSSKDISGATAVVFNELTRLGVDMERCGIILYDETPISKVWSTLLSPENKEVVEIITGDLNSDIHPMLQKSYKEWKNKKDYFAYELKGIEVKKYYDLLEKLPGYRFPKIKNYPKIQILNSFLFDEGGLFVYTTSPLTNEVKNIFLRFTKVFSLTYRRYLDIVKAEAQAREAQIEASLERVRAKAMAMHSSKDISGATAVVFDELTRLGIDMERCGIVILDETPVMEVWSTLLSPENKKVIEVINGKLNSDIHVMLQEIYKAWTDRKEFFAYTLVGDEVQKYYDKLEKEPGYQFPKVANYPDQQIANCFYFNKGYVFAYTLNNLSDSDKIVFKRFTNVFSLTYRRYQDLIIAEAQAREAIKQTSLNRVRGEIASMRNAEDLKRLTPVIWHELKELEVPFIRCGVFIIDEETEKTKAYLSTPEGKALAVLNLKIDENKLTKNTVDFWRKNQVYNEHWNKEDFINWLKSMMKTGQVKSAEEYLGSADAPESLHLHFTPFKQGMLYVGNTSPLSLEELDLVGSLATSFSMAYARYEDFKQLETAKNQIEKTLTELKSTQAQLIQSEKMASLGELTAGIAHEIQNPLNFVNNFSEISNELIEEMKGERIKDKGERDEELEGEILNDISQNLEKILHHGKRADAIVKGMLQHSRTSTGQKEPTDINALADEYLRLSYHGLRAKDKSFNADYKTDFDPNLPKVEVIPQDIGRVLLNLINNAFYAVSEKHKIPMGSKTPSGLDDYKPAVTITTKNLGDKIEISVKDNGPGIPEEIKNKIFQPFFTTKPTGEGTGLGLSLSYDIIVKLHGGEIKVKSALGAGTEFIIVLPK